MLRVNELFGPTFQGEGKSAGMTCSFLRLATCNLHCIWCDTPFTWNWKGSKWQHPEKFEKKNEIHLMSIDEAIYEIECNDVKALVISGGEPFLQQRPLIQLCQKLKKLGYWIEVETNGTLMPQQQFVDLVNQINCSPKLSNSGDPVRLREHTKVLEALSANSKTNFKFVIVTEVDVQQVLYLQDRYKMKEIRLMPEAQTREELLDKSLWVRQLCHQYGFIFCTRLSIMVSGTKRRV